MGSGPPERVAYAPMRPARRGTAFDARVYALVRAIPEGRVSTYGALALALEHPHGARQVGWALARVPRADEPDVPAHRVVNARGALSGGWAFGAPEIQRGLLEDEGVEFDAAGCVPLDRFGWQPPSRPNAPAETSSAPPRPVRRRRKQRGSPV